MTATELLPYLIPVAFAGTGWVVKTSVSTAVGQFSVSIKELNKKLEKIEDTLGNAVTQVTTVLVRSETHGAEIDKLRVKLHEVEADVTALDAVQSRCRTCSPRV